MNGLIIAVSGLVYTPEGNKGSAGAGKSTVSRRLIDKHGFVEIGFADVMKRFVQELFDFTHEQLWGPTEERNKPDERYKRIVRPKDFLDEARLASIREIDEGLGVKQPQEYYESLTPRYALQQLGTAWGRQQCWSDVWVAYAMRVAKKLMTLGVSYDPKVGLCDPSAYIARDPEHALRMSPGGVVFNDLRFKNELAYVKNNGGKVIRIKRPVKELFVPNDHLSENDLNDVPDSDFDYIIEGTEKSVGYLQLQTDRMMDVYKGRLMPYDDEQADIPPFMRKGAPSQL